MAANYFWNELDTVYESFPSFYKRDSFCDFLFAVLHMKRRSEKGFILKDRLCFLM